jgi:retron-type reverse transcriptase
VIFCLPGALSPLLSNIALGQLGRELERRGLRLARYAGGSNICVRSRSATEAGVAGSDMESNRPPAA